MVIKLNENALMVDGLAVYKPKNDKNWYACNGKIIGTIRLQALYLFLLKDEKECINQFNNYVDSILAELIYN